MSENYPPLSGRYTPTEAEIVDGFVPIGNGLVRTIHKDETRRGMAKVKATALRDAAVEMRKWVDGANENQRFTEHELIENGIEHVLNEYADLIENHEVDRSLDIGADGAGWA